MTPDNEIKRAPAPAPRDDLTAIQRVLVRRVLADSPPDLHELIRRFGGYANITRARARFIVEAADQADVDFVIHNARRGPVVFVHVPTAATVRRRRACAASFRRANRHDLRAVALLAAKPEGRA